MVPIERVFRSQCEIELLEQIESGIAVRETSLGDEHNAEIEALNEASVHLIQVRRALERAKAEAQHECQQELLQQQLRSSVAQFRNRKAGSSHVS